MKGIKTMKEALKKTLAWKQAEERVEKSWGVLAEIFHISELSFTPAAAADLYGKELSNKLRNVKLCEGSRKLLVVAPGEDVDWPCCDADDLLSARDLFSILSAPAEKHVMLPQLFNTVENLYQHFYIIGSSPFAASVRSYLAENTEISVETLRTDAVRADADGYHVDVATESDTLLIFADLCPVRRVFGREGKTAIAMFAKLLFSPGTDSVNGADDAKYNIVPRLLESGIPVLRVYMPSVDRMPNRRLLKGSIFCWHVFRKLNETAFMKARNRRRGTAYLEENQNSLTNDNSRGYSIMYGSGEYINFENGFRRTIGNTPEAKHTLHVFGPCFVRGLSVEDADTIPSLLQKWVPDSYNVRNWGSEFGTCNYIMRQTEFRAGDAVILFLLDTAASDDGSTPCWDMNDTYRKIPKIHTHVDDDIAHFDLTIQKQLAEDLYAALERNGMLSGNTKKAKPIAFGPQKKRAADIARFSEDESLKTWIAELRKTYPYLGQCRGSIVMNCNPFTRGHQYLIETAAKSVDELFVFVVQENKSYFTFEQRFQMVLAGTQHLENVRIVPSGTYIISSKTLPGYFEKAVLTDAVVDAADDLSYFAQQAAALNISVRFAGTEPKDPYTRRYNENMQRYLPKYGIEFREIERMSCDDRPISATNVRLAIEKNDIETISRIVPETTLQHLYAYGYLKDAEIKE